MKEEVKKIIADAAKKAAEEVVRQQNAVVRSNHYKDTERLLRNYKAMKRLYDHPEEYPLVPPEKSKSVTVAPPSGSGFRSREDIMDEVIEARLRSYGVSCAQFRWIDDVIKQFENKPEFIVIRMYYFGEDANGNVTQFNNNCNGQPVDAPLNTMTAKSNHFGEVCAFLTKYYGNGENAISCDQPAPTITAKDRMALVTVRGQDYRIVDIGLRMLTPRELFDAQGFPPDYIIDVDADGKPYPKSEQVARCGNAVCPPIPAALVRANLPELCAVQAAS